MTTLRNMSIKMKLSMAFAVVLLLTLALGLFAVQRLAQVNLAAADIRDNWMPATRAIGDYSFHTMRFRQIEAAALLAPTPELAAKEAATLVQVAADAQKAWSGYEAKITSAEDRAMAERIKSGWQDYLALDRKMIEQARSGDRTGAYASYVGNMRSAYNGWRDVVVGNIDLQLRQATAAARHGEEVYTSARLLIFGAIALAAGLCALAAFLIIAGVSWPMQRMTVAMGKLADGDFDVVLPGLGQKDEIGAMAGAVERFKVKAAEKARLDMEAKAEQERAAAAKRKAEMQKLADEFEAAVGEIVRIVSSASTELEASATSLTKTAETGQRLANAVASASEEASTNVQSVASATEEMASSITEISRQVQESSRISTEAVNQAQKTDDRITRLAQAANRIGDVTQLITTIAEQTNLLALNATIEAARAGEAGKGFAVVAQEVKALAAQTAKATSEISGQIAGMQEATQDSVAAIKEIGGTIARISEIATTIASAVEEQSAATQEITRNVQQASAGTTQVASNVTNVSRGAAETGSASSQVLSSAQSLANESNRLKLEMAKFLVTVRAA